MLRAGQRLLQVAGPSCQAQRALSVGVASQQKQDPIQQLFVQKLREYREKSKKAGGKPVDFTPESTKDLQKMLAKVRSKYGADKEDFNKFPDFSFRDGRVDNPGDVTYKDLLK